MSATLRPLLVIFTLLTTVTGFVYPMVMTGIGRVAFLTKLREPGDPRSKGRGSALIGQAFQEPRDFWGRPSATSPMPNNGLASEDRILGRPIRRFWTR